VRDLVAISVIVPVYNGEPYLRRCLDSLLAQTLEGIEVIAVCDVSQDDSPGILREYQARHPNIVIIEPNANRRQGGARNLGIEAASGEYIAFVDCDDWMAPGMLERLYLKAKGTGADIVDCDFVRTDGLSFEPKVSLRPECTGAMDLDKRRGAMLDGGALWTKLYRRSLLIDNAVRFPEGVAYEDLLFLPLALAYARNVQKVPEPLYYYFKRPGATTQARNAMHHFDRPKVAGMLVRELKDRGLYAPYQEEVSWQLIVVYLETVYKALSSFDRPPVAQLYELRAFMRANLPGYRTNRYYRESAQGWLRGLGALNDLSPRLLVLLYGTYKKVVP
jgi:glycosyltransferase involved in cell wall biosynthesis